jgi:hypothetical protein
MFWWQYVIRNICPINVIKSSFMGDHFRASRKLVERLRWKRRTLFRQILPRRFGLQTGPTNQQHKHIANKT